MTESLLNVRDLGVRFNLHGRGTVQAVNGVSFRVPAGRTVALVGESGSGKSVISQAIMGILPKAAQITSGSIEFFDRALEPEGTPAALDIAKLDPNGGQMRDIRGSRISMIFQEPMTSLSPLHTIGDQISEAVLLHRPSTVNEARDNAQAMLERVGFPNPRRALDTYPFELSGGLRQRAMIAMALVCRPSFAYCRRTDYCSRCHHPSLRF